MIFLEKILFLNFCVKMGQNNPKWNFSIWKLNGNFQIFFCLKHEEQQHKCLKLIQIIFLGVLGFLGQKGTQNLFLGFVTNRCIEFISFYAWSYHSKGWKLDKIVLKLNFHLQKKMFWFNKSFLKMLKNAFYFILKALFILNIFNFLFWLFGHVEKTAWLER